MEAQEKGGVTIREYLDMQIAFVKSELGHVREKILHEKELGSRASEALTKALELQAEKYEQRLTSLNHEAQRLSAMVTREMFEEVISSLRKDVDELKQERSKREGRSSISNIISIVGVAIAAAALFFSVYK